MPSAATNIVICNLSSVISLAEAASQSKPSHFRLAAARTRLAGALVPAGALRVCVSADSLSRAEVRKGGPSRLQATARIRMACKEKKEELLRTKTFGKRKDGKRVANIHAPGDYRSA